VAVLDKTLICLLVINKIQEMPHLSLNSILKSTSENILVGYIRESDVSELSRDSRISYVDISSMASIEGALNSSRYVDFSQEQFYQLVQYKWVLLEYAATLDFTTIIFSDFDVYWNRSPIAAMNTVFSENPQVIVQIQTYTSSPDKEELCMGFVAFKNGSEFKNLVTSLAEIHRVSLMHKAFTGDDNVISDYYRENESFRGQVRLLPQSTFPTGNLINAYAKKNYFPGLVPYEPFIFHANFVVGSSKKIKLLKTFIYGSQFGEENARETVRLKLSLIILRTGVFVKRLFK
jgi:hypothetical protein